VKCHPISIFMRQTLLALGLSPFAVFAHANAIHDAHADDLLSIDAVTNLTNAGKTFTSRMKANRNTRKAERESGSAE